MSAWTDEALRELVALKDLKAEIERLGSLPAGTTGENIANYAEAWAEYARRKPLAWEAARAALVAHLASADPQPVALPDDIVRFICSIADNLGDMPISDDYAERMDRRARELLDKYDAEIQTDALAAEARDAEIMRAETLRQERDSYRAGNTELLELLMRLCLGESTEPLTRARDILTGAGLMNADHTPNWQALEDRKPKPQTWEEAVRECVSDPAEVARLLAFADDAAMGTQASEQPDPKP